MSKISLVDQFYISNSSAILANILNPGTNLCIWKRRVNQNVLDYAKQLILIPKFSMECEVNETSEWKKNLPLFDDVSEIPFVEDIQRISKIFSTIANVSRPKIHLSVVNYMQCPLYHVDYVKMRLICTYIGKGTLWVPNVDVDRNHLGCGRNDHLIKSLDAVRQAENFDVLLMKGEANPTDLKNGLIHKSPETKGESRLFLRIDSA